MELSKDTQLMALVASPATTSYGTLLDEQKDLFQTQIEKLQQIVATQCKLTGVNPLSQEMAASALSIKIGKRPRDLLNPKAVKYMQLVFSMKDAISKRETREISAQFGVTVTQVRDFFAGQRTRVRKFVRLSREKANTSANGLIHDGITSTSSLDMPVEAIPLATVAPTSIDEGPSGSKRHEVLSGLADSDKHFVENIFGLMRKEESFSGQVKLIRWILRMTNPSVLNWFLIEGGLMILATWISEAATEEQTSVLVVILKALDYLPVSKALPGHMSAILQSVNRLRFYRASDISNRARTMLSKWSKMLGKNLSSKKSNGLKSASDLQDEMLLKQSICEVMDNESWDLKKENHEDGLRFICENPDSPRKLDTAQPLKMLTAPGDDSNKRRGAFPPQTRERRKVQLVEHPGQRLAARSPQVARSTSAMQSRPLSADDIQKAKMRAHFMQSKHGKIIIPDEKIKSESEKQKSESENKLTSTSSHASLATFVSKSNVLGEPEEHNPDDSSSKLSNQLEEQRNPDDSSSKLSNKFEEQRNPDDSSSKLSNQLEEQRNPDDSSSKLSNQLEEQRKPDDSSLPKLSNPHENSLILEESPCKKYKTIPIPWKTPPEVKIDETWSVGDGANSKEVEVQNNRIRREREIVYWTTEEIPSDPREPWDREMDCDDSLTLEIPIEQLPDIEPLETPSNPPNSSNGVVGPTSESMSQPDFELLAELLKNPELVFALTSGQAGNLSSDETVKLLDRIKANGVSSLGNLAGNDNNKVEVSLPSPTPSSDPAPNGALHDFTRNPFSRQHGLANGNAYQVAQAAVPSRQQGMVSSSTQIPATTILTPQPSATVQQYHHKVAPSSASPEQWQQGHTNPQMYHQSRLNSSNVQHFTSEMLLNSNTMADTHVASSSATWPDPSGPSRSATPPNSSRARHGYESNYPYQNNRSVNYHHSYGGGSAALPSGTWGGRNNVPDWAYRQSRSPDNSPSRRHDYVPSRHHNEASVSLRNGYRHGKGMQQNPQQHSGYQDSGNKRWQDRRR